MDIHMQALVDTSKQAQQDSGEKMRKYNSRLDRLVKLLQQMIDQNQNSNSSPNKMNSPNS